MARVTKSVTAKARHKKVLQSTKGHYGARSRLYKTAKQSNIKSLQYPVNIRISENKNFPKKYREYDTRFIHCDSWSGAPKDSFNAFIYLIPHFIIEIYLIKYLL